jgi:site-specific DNA recombinase
MKAIIVARVSTEEQREAGNSLPAQLKRMQDYCDRNGYTRAETFSFDESAYKTKRDEFDAIIKRIEEFITKKEKVAVCFDKVDRLSRNIFDKRVAWLYEKAVNDEIELHFVSDSQVINNSMNAGDKFAFGMKLGLSKYYSDAISDNVKRAFEQKRRNGEWTGPVRLGYLNISLDEGKRLRKDIVIDPDRGHLIQRLFELYATGNYSLETLRIKVTDEGLLSLKNYKLSKSNIENIIKDSFYCGIAMSHKYGTYLHKYPALISKDLFDRCQEIRRERKATPYKALSKDFIFKGLLHCPKCGCSMSAEIKKGRYIYYSCTNAKGTCKREYVPEETLLKPVYELLERFESISEDTCNELVDELRKATEAEVSYHKAQVSRIRNEYDKLKEKDNRLLDLYTDAGITKDTYDIKHQEYADKLQLLNIELAEHTNADYEYQTVVATVLSVARRAKTIFERCSEPAQKRAFLNYLLQNPTVSGKKLIYKLHSPFNLILELPSSNMAPRAGLEPATNPLTAGRSTN